MASSLRRMKTKPSCRRLFVLLAPAVVWLSIVCSCAGQSAGAQPSSRWQWSFTLRNRTALRMNRPRVLQMSRNVLEVRGVYKPQDQWGFSAEGRAHYDPVGRLGYPRKLWLDPRELLIEAEFKSASLSLGLQQTVWGQADGLRVLDVINPLDYREFILEDFLDSRRPLWTVRADIPIRKGSLQLLWIPHFASGRLPGSGDEFGIGPSFGLSLIEGKLGNRTLGLPSVTVLPTRHPGLRLSSGQAGARYSRSLGRWDVTANYFYGWEDIPTPYLRFSGFPLIDPKVTITPRYDRKEVFGGTAATHFGPVVVRAELGWNPRRAAAATLAASRSGFQRTGQLGGVAGLDYSPTPWLWLSGQYFLQLATAPQRALLLPRYNQLVSIYARTNFFRETLRPELFVLAGLNQRQYMIRPRITRDFGSYWHASLGADFLQGADTTPFGFFGARDRCVVELKWMR